MKDFIKTGEEIFKEIDEYSDISGEHEWSKKRFIQLDWLLEYLKQEEDFHHLCTEEECDVLHFVLRLRRRLLE